jgi:L-ascorbate metabolism protein UlaG (beta-lactamase superfamily)
MNGVRLLTDPLLRNHLAFLRRRTISVQPEWTRNIDGILLSHAHRDHLDAPSLHQLLHMNPTTQIIVPTGVGTIVQRLGFDKIKEVQPGDEMQIGNLWIRTTAAQHGTHKRFFELTKPDTVCVGYVIHGENSVYFAGDTDIFPEMANLAGTLDLALLPVGGWGPTLGPGHLDPYRAAEALTLLAPRHAIPIHWGTLVPWGFDWFHPRYLVDPPHLFAQFASTLAPNVDVRVLSPGEQFVLGA